jgi:ABC-type bacteriocin/lantibiotic exporter with double-glycine peptidase domain
MKCREIFLKKSKVVLESVSGYKEICINQKKDFFVKEYNDINEEACKLNTSYLLIMRIPSRAIETVFIACLLGLVCMRVEMYDDNSRFVSLIGAIGVAAIRILPSISNISGYINGLIYNRPSMESAYNNIVQVREEETKYNMRQKQKLILDNDIVFSDAISLKNITFRYDNTDVDVLNDISFDIHKGDSIGIIGESGAGKSTLLDVLLGLLKPQNGKVLMDGHNIEDIPFDWAENVGYVPQSVYLMDDTIKRNIAFGVNDKDIDDDKIWECLKEAQLDEFVRELPEGLNTSVGERGIRFSGGQRQRVAIARALYHDPQILVLDEATSALDNETEKEVMRSIDGFRGKLTIIIVAHRLTTIENCDYIYRVADGKVRIEKAGI